MDTIVNIFHLDYTTIVQAVNFLLIFWLLKVMVYPMILEGVQKREATIAKLLDDAESVNAEALNLKDEYEAKLRDAKKEAQAAMQQASSEGERLKGEIVEAAKREAARVTESAKADTAREKDKALADLRTHVGGLAVSLAAKALQGSLDDSTQHQMVERLTKKVAELHAS